MLRVIFSNNNPTQFQSDLARILNLMNPLSVKIGTHIDTYAAKVTLEYQGHYDETSMKILREGACLGDGFCGSCEVYAYDLDENGNPDNCYMFKKPKSYEYNAYTNRINVEIEFDEVYGGPSIDKECNEIEKMKYYITMLRKSMKDEFDKNSYNPRFLGVLDSIDQLPKEASDGDMYMVREQTKINVHGDMTNVTINTTYVRSSDVWLVYQKETFHEE